jgi:hypothetical protein
MNAVVSNKTGRDFVSPGARANIFYDGPKAPNGVMMLLADDFIQKPLGREFELVRLARGESKSYSRTLHLRRPRSLPADTAVTASFEVAADAYWNDVNRMACLAANRTLGVCPIAMNERKQAACVGDNSCRPIDLKLDAAGHQVEGVVEKEVSIRLSDCSVL